MTDAPTYWLTTEYDPTERADNWRPDTITVKAWAQRLDLASRLYKGGMSGERALRLCDPSDEPLCFAMAMGCALNR